MPKRDDISTILLVGAGPIVVGQACEFDYSGTQACKALREEGYRVVLVNSNPATIMTDPGLADATYIEPVRPETLRKVIEREKPDAMLPTMGGQTALNAAMALARDGSLAALGVELIGADADVIDKAEDRARFRQAMTAIGLETPRARMVHNQAEAAAALQQTGLPAIVRPSFTLGGTGGGIAYNKDEFSDIVAGGLAASPVGSVLVEESVLGWKEFEMEVVRDRADNCIIVCAIENIDPMGVHTGDSMTVAPALTLTDKEYQRLRNASIAVLREIGVDTGGSNVQFAIHPGDGRLVVIEMNPRVSRSSALASKATGFPIARVAAKLAVGYTLDELDNDITGVTPASFEPAIDYVVTKIPRFAFEKFPGARPWLTTAMKSVGEVMAIGRSFEESLQKALRGLETGLSGLDSRLGDTAHQAGDTEDSLRAALGQPTPDRLLVTADAMRAGLPVAEIRRLTGYDPWFLDRIAGIVAAEKTVAEAGLPDDRHGLRRLKGMGFSDARLASLAGTTTAAVAAKRAALGVRPVFRRVDTCAAEFASRTPYMYATYGPDPEAAGACEARPGAGEKVIILGGGPNRIGQGIEFDYCCCHAVFALREAGYETIMVNCNPETVSTDYDTADRLYFEPLVTEDVVEICRIEQSRGHLKGVIVQFGGQTPLKLSADLLAAGIPILGTPPDAIDLAEDRRRFHDLLRDLGLRQPASGTATSVAEALAVARTLSYPLLLRPSYVLGGRAMRIVHNDDELQQYIGATARETGDSPILIDSCLREAVEVDVDALADADGAVRIAGIMEHIEEAGIHSGDSACSLPPQTLDDRILAGIERQTEALAVALGVIGLMNVQFAIQGDDIHVLEVNPRASRTVPFVAKATGQPVAGIAARLMAGEKLAGFPPPRTRPGHVAVKEAVFPFNRFPGVDTMLGPEMKSTGEAMGLDHDFGLAFAKSQLGAGADLPSTGTAFFSVRDRDKPAMVALARRLGACGFHLLATRGTAAALSAAAIDVECINKVLEGRPHIVDAMRSDRVSLVINTTEGAAAIADSYDLRRTALTTGIPYCTTLSAAQAVVRAIEAARRHSLEVAPLQSYF